MVKNNDLNEFNTEKRGFLFCLLALIFIGLISLGYVLYGRSFAEINIQLPFLNFPIFIGEILIFICLICFFGLYTRRGIAFHKLNTWHYLLISYFIFVVLRAIYGYIIWGPLALRDAALFYYPIFSVFGYSFYKKRIFNTTVNILLLFGIICLLACPAFNSYWLLTCFILACLLIKTCPRRLIRYLLFLILFCIMPYQRFFRTSRMMMIGNYIAALYLIIAASAIIKCKKNVKRIAFTIAILLLLVGIIKFSDYNALKSIVATRNLICLYQEYNNQIIEEGKNFKPLEIKKVKLYNPEVRSVKDLNLRIIEAIETRITKVQEKIAEIHPEKDSSLGLNNDVVPAERKESPGQIETVNLADQAQTRITKVQEKIAEIHPKKEEGLPEEKSPLRSLDEAQINALFRIFIWRDMMDQLKKEKPIFGIDFGKPLRSKSLEILHWGEVDWLRDGWIAAHNSYFNIIYRTGIIGALIIIVFLFVLFRMIKEFIFHRSVTGILLCGIIINWFVAANFLLIFELPYTAIPIWTLYGMTFAYYCRLKSTKHVEG